MTTGSIPGSTTDEVATPAPLQATARDGTPVTIRLATEADEPELQRFFASVTMDADLQLAVHRTPALLDMYRIQDKVCEVWIGLIGDEVVGLGALLVGNGLLDGRPARLGYLGDLRLDRRIRGRSVLTAMYGTVMDGFADRHGVDLFLTAVIQSNDRAVQALTSPKAHEHGIPKYHELRRFDIRAVHLLQPRRRPRTPGIEVSRACEADIPEIATFLDGEDRLAPFGEGMTEDQLRQRIASWPGLQVEDFRIARRCEGGEPGPVVGCMAPWAADGVKQTMVLSYRGGMRRIRLAYNLVAGLLRAPRLPKAGGQLRYLYATHNAVAGGDVQVQRALLGAVYADLRRSGNVFLSCFVPQGDPLEPAYRGYLCNHLHACIYGVVPRGGELPAGALAAGRPRFEMALV